MTHKYNFENATEKRQADKELGHITTPYPDGQVKHPEHLKQHEMLQVLQRHALNEEWTLLRSMITTELPEHQRSDTIHMLKKTLLDPLIGKKFPDEEWFRKRADENETRQK
jgi:hypothetical protein|tara:strand:+ start:127 stop:459 length:333 start_codon:yes stop_codon:yes gene_type:complete